MFDKIKSAIFSIKNNKNFLISIKSLKDLEYFKNTEQGEIVQHKDRDKPHGKKEYIVGGSDVPMKDTSRRHPDSPQTRPPRQFGIDFGCLPLEVARF